MKNSQKGAIMPIVIILALLIIGGGTYYFYNKGKPTSYNNPELVNSYPILSNESLWRSKLISTDNPEKWTVPEENVTIQATNYSGSFLCGNTKAEFTKFSSYNTGAVGGWNNISVVSCGDYYFVFEYGDAGPKLYGPFDKNGTPTSSSLQILFPNGGEVLEIGKSYDLKWQNNSGNPVKTLALQTFGTNGQDYGFHNIITSNIPSSNSASIQWKVPTSIDPQYNYKLVAFDGNRKIIGQSVNDFKITGLNVENPIVSSMVFEIGKPFSVSGKPQSGSGFAPLYTSDKILQKSLVTARVYAFFADACSRSSAPDPNCPLKGEQMVRIDVSIESSEKAIYLTNKTRNSQSYQGYTIKLISVDSVNQQAVISITKN